MRLLLALALCSSPLFATFTTTVQWDIRTTGSNNNGGGFDTSASGTDRSQSNAAFIAFTDLVIGGTTTQATSAAHPFGSTSPGNIVNILSGSGCTVQRAQVVSVSGVTATFDRSLGTGASTCTANLGGALASLSPLFTGLSTSVIVPGNTAWVQTGTYTVSTSILTQSVSNLLPVTVEGYNSTHGDYGTAPLFTTSTSSTSLFTISGGSGTLAFVNLHLSNTALVRAPGLDRSGGGSYPVLVLADVVLDGFSVGINGHNSGAGAVYETILTTATEIKNCTSSAIINYFNVQLGQGTYIHNNGGDAVVVELGTDVLINGTIIANNTGKGLNSAATLGISNAIPVNINNSTFANNTGDNIFLSSGAAQIVNTISYGSGGFGVTAPVDGNGNVDNPAAFATRNNAFGANTSGDRSNFPVGRNDKTLSASPFTNSAGGDYSLNNTAGGGALLRTAGYAGIFGGGLSTGYLDIGAVQTSGGPGTGTNPHSAAYVQ